MAGACPACCGRTAGGYDPASAELVGRGMAEVQQHVLERVRERNAPLGHALDGEARVGHTARTVVYRLFEERYEARERPNGRSDHSDWFVR